MNNKFAEAARRSNKSSAVLTLLVFIAMCGITIAAVDFIIIGAMEINMSNLKEALLQSFSSWDENIPLEDVTIEMRKAVRIAKSKSSYNLDTVLNSTLIQVHMLIRTTCMLSFIFTFIVSMAISRSFVSTLDMKMSNLGPASLQAVRGTIDEVLTQYETKGGRK